MTASADNLMSTIECKDCGQHLRPNKFSKSQRKRQHIGARCKVCVSRGAQQDGAVLLAPVVRDGEERMVNCERCVRTVSKSDAAAMDGRCPACYNKLCHHCRSNAVDTYDSRPADVPLMLLREG